ncbi:preprotein translocase subunit SecG [Candidatus Peregrinibacteria bacterium]|nr:MAG: preprotein translocase subunit SecG [Candidatus Peregrinibacteria bacterium]
MQTTILIIQQVIGVLLILLILIQEKGSGLGEAIGGVGGTYQSTKRGAEKVLSRTTVLFLFIFLGLSLTLNFI